MSLRCDHTTNLTPKQEGLCGFGLFSIKEKQGSALKALPSKKDFFTLGCDGTQQGCAAVSCSQCEHSVTLDWLW